MNKFFLFVWLLALGHNSVANNQFNDFFNALDSLSADFKQNTYSDTNTLVATSSGQLLFNRPQQLRWHTTQPNEQILLLNNNELWLIDTELEQATLQKIQEISQTPLYWLINKPASNNNTPEFAYRENNIDFYRANNTNSEYTNLLFAFKQNTLYAISVNNILGQKIVIIFDNVTTNPQIDQSVFELKINPEFDVIR